MKYLKQKTTEPEKYYKVYKKQLLNKKSYQNVKEIPRDHGK